MTLLETTRVKLAAAISVAGSLCFLFLLVIIVADVVLRAIDPSFRIFGVLDLVELSLDWVFFLAIPLALFEGRVVSVDLIDGIDRRGVLERIGAFLTLATFVLLGTKVVTPALDMLQWQDRTLDLGILKFYYWVPIWIGVALCCVASTIGLLRLLGVK